MLLTSGIGGVYPKGYPVAIVTSVGISDSQPFAAIKARPLVETDKMRYVLMFGTSSDTPDAEEYALQAKQMTDDKTILHQKKVKDLIDTLSVKKNDKNRNAEKKEDKKSNVGGTND